MACALFVATDSSKARHFICTCTLLLTHLSAVLHAAFTAHPTPPPPHAPRPTITTTEMRNTTWSVFSRPPMNSSLTTSDPAARDARTRHTSHTPRLHALPSIPGQCCLVVLTQPPDPPHHLLQAGARPEDRSRCARLQLASRYALQRPQHTPHTAPHTPHTHGRAHGCEEMCSRRSTYFWPSHIC